MSHFTLLTVCSTVLLLTTMTGCADTESEFVSQNAEKSWWTEDHSTTWDQGVDADWGSRQDESADDGFSSWGESDSEITATNRSQEASLGSSCASGCVWSAYAVTMGAQSSEASCGGQGCACVVEGDIYSSCSASPDSNSSPNHDSGQSSRPSDDQYNASVGNRIADEAYYIASRRNTVGYCYSAAADAIEAVVGTFLWGSSAYMAADQLAAHPRFFEVSVSNLRTLPAGAVVVWGRGSSAHGHISVALGDGREASDHIAQQMTYHYGGAGARVFYPN